MRIHAGAFRVPKRGNAPEECEDKYSPDPPLSESELPFSFAVADGATTASYSGVWASIVTNSFVQMDGKFDQLIVGLPDMRKSWREQTHRDERPWYAAAKYEEGAYTTFLGVRIETDTSGNAVATIHAIGDTCAFLFTSNGERQSFPFIANDQFPPAPSLLCSRLEQPLEPQIQSVSWDIAPNNLLLVATDALAAWLLSELSSNGVPNQVKAVLAGETSFDALIDDLRDKRAIKNDDCALFWAECLGR